MKAALLLALVGDLDAESADLDARVAGLDETGALTPTPADGWSIADTIAHLAATDRDAHLAATDPDGFAALLIRVAATGPSYVDDLVLGARTTPWTDALRQWRDGRAELREILVGLDPDSRVPWFGPPMSPVSFVTARLMETWAHGQDVSDALGQVRTPTARLRSVAEIGVRARPFAYLVHGLPVPAAPVRVELTGPDGDTWTWGPEVAEDIISGPALDWCLLVTQRRHRDDLCLDVTGIHAQEWAGIAQAFAGAPGGGRAPLS